MSLPFQCVYFPRVLCSRAESLYIIRRLTVGSGSQSAGPHRGSFHQTAPALPARHIQDAILMWLSFEKSTRLVIVMTSPAVLCRCWLKSLFWLVEFCQWDTRSWNRSLWSFLTNTPPPHPTPLHPPAPATHVLVEGCAVPPREAPSHPDASQRCLLLLRHLH